YSGRTAMQANRNVVEPKPLQDEHSPFSFTMEGHMGIAPSAAIPFFWAPGWNSGNSVNKYQQEIGGSLRDGDPGVRLFQREAEHPLTFFRDLPEPFVQRDRKWLLLPQHHVFGSDELSVYTKGIQDLSPEPYIGLSPKDAALLQVATG